MSQSTFVEKVRQAIESHRLLSPGAKVIVGISGGADSVALFMALHTLGYDCVAAHCNFQLRGDESMRDEMHTHALVNGIGKTIETIRFNVNDYIASRPRPTSMEMACRELRYEWFEKLRQSHRAEAIAVAHNADDNAETLLLNLFRGTGIAGLKGMLPINDRHIIRPLLHCSRQEIESYLRLTSTGYVTDSSNLTTDFTRNRLRNAVIPLIRTSFPNAPKAIGTTLDNMRASYSFYRRMIAEKRSHYTTADGSLRLRELLEREPDSALLLHEWLSSRGLTADNIRSLMQCADISGRRFHTDNGYFYTDRGLLRFAHPTAEIPPLLESIFSISRSPVADFKPSGSRMEAYFDIGILSHGPLKVRYWQPGDRVKPYGMHGSRKVSDIFSDMKVPVGIKDRIPLLTCGGDIVWIAPLRASSLYPVTSATKEFLTVRYIGPKLF